MLRFRIFPLFVLCLALSSCGSIRQALVSMEEEYNRTWSGKSHSEIVQTFGAPDRVMSDGKDGSILVYERTELFSSSYVYPLVPGPVGPSVSTEKYYTHFFLTGEGRCYLVKTNQVMPGGETERARNGLYWGLAGAVLATPLLILLIHGPSRHDRPSF